jgi:hypothetical protein
MNTPFSILPILQLCKKYAINMNTPYFYIPKNIKYEKNAEYDNHPPGVTAAVRPGVGTKNMTNMRNMRNMQNNNFCKGTFLCLFASSIDSTTSGSMCRSTQQ